MNGNSSIQVLNSFSEVTKELSVVTTIKTGTQKYNFSLAQNSQTLQGTLLQNITYQFSSNVTKDANGNTITTEAICDSSRLFLKAMDGSTLAVDGIPLIRFKTGTANAPYLAFADLEIDWQNSYLQLETTGQAGQNGQVIEFFVNYRYK